MPPQPSTRVTSSSSVAHQSSILRRAEAPLTFEEFASILNSLHSDEVQRIYRHLERSSIFRPFLLGGDRLTRDNVDMVLGNGNNTNTGNTGDTNADDDPIANGAAILPFGDGGEEVGEEQDPAAVAAARIQALRTASCIRILGKGVIRVVHRVDDARQSNNLDLSHCQLMQVPDAVYYLMRNTPLIACDLSCNVITKVPPKLPAKFAFIKRLNLSHNRMSSLPEEFNELTQLEMVDISHNSFISIPSCLFTAARVLEIDASSNYITEVEAHLVKASPKLKKLDLEENPLSRQTEQQLSEVKGIEIKITQRGLQEWEDLEI